MRLPFLAVAIAVLPATAVRADPCGRPDLLETFPANGATDVPVNARLSAHYAATAEYIDEEVTLEHVGFAAETPRAMFDASEGLLAIQPSAPLVAGDDYIVRWPSLRGLTTAVAGKGAEVKFTAGSTPDLDSPSFSGLRDVAWDVERVNDDCTDALEDRFVFDLGLGEATDDGGQGMLSLLVFQSKGGSASSSPAPVLTRRFADAGRSVRVQRSIDSAAGNVCFAALVRDASGRVSNSADREVCVTTVKPPFFYGCAISPVREACETRGALGVGIVTLLAWAGAPRRTGRRRRHRA